MSYLSKIVLPNNTEYDLKDRAAHWYGVVDTAAAEAIKEVSIENFVLITGTKITLTFEYANSASNPSLSINEATAIPFALINDNAALWNDGETCEFIYDGTAWNLINYDKVEVIRL